MKLNRLTILRSFLLTLVAVFTSSMLSAQMIDNRLGNAFKQEMYFSQQFIWMNKVKAVTGIVSVKRPNRPIDTKPDMVVYRFNQVGLLERIDKVSSIADLVDSLTIIYKRNDLGEVELKSESGTKGFFMTKFNYDSNGRIVRLDYSKATNVSTEKNKLEAGEVVTINSETYTWHDGGNGSWRRSNYNNYGLQYSNMTIKRNELGYITEEVEELIMSGRTTTRNYSYNEHGWVSSIETTNNLNPVKKKERFLYDALGNLLKLEYLEDDVMVREIEVLYTPTMLVEAILDHDLKSHDIVITKMRYEYYNK
jgi:hypothetical protein